MARPSEQSRFDYYTEDAQAVHRAYKNARLFAAKMVGYVALLYGVVTLSPYYAILGLSLVALFWWFDRKIASAAKQIEGSPSRSPSHDLPSP